MSADDKGYFHFSRDVDFLISNVGIEARAPDGRYAGAGSSLELDLLFTYKGSPHKGRDQYFFIPGKGYFRLYVYELPQEDQRHPRYRYDSFAGGLGGEPEQVAQ
jgi:hypothetical protein